jgi:hypothetical protein
LSRISIREHVIVRGFQESRRFILKELASEKRDADRKRVAAPVQLELFHTIPDLQHVQGLLCVAVIRYPFRLEEQFPRIRHEQRERLLAVGEDWLIVDFDRSDGRQ